METTALPSSCAVALKEWASVLSAMGQGAQLLLIRKGGLIEPGGGFALAAPTFVFYPTFEHQAVNYLRPEFRRYFEDAQRHRAPEGRVRIDFAGAAVSSVQSADPALIQRLEPFHVYNEAFVTQRLKWQPDQPVTVVVVRVFRLPSPQVLTVAPRYAGCTSWVDLEAPLAVAGAVPVLDETAFQRRLHTLQPLLPSA